jgi:DNA repair protein RecO
VIELITEAIVLDKTPWRECDARVLLYTEHVGLVRATATSARAPRAKLNAHLEPLNVIIVRLAQRQENESALFQISDALILDHCVAWRDTAEHAQCGLEVLGFLRQQQTGDADDAVWDTAKKMLSEPPRATAVEYQKQLLNVMGFAPEYATCAVCSVGVAAAFDFVHAVFYCEGCARLGADNDSVVSIV